MLSTRWRPRVALSSEIQLLMLDSAPFSTRQARSSSMPSSWMANISDQVQLQLYGPTLHPVSVARLVMDSSDHALLVGPGATAFAVENGISMVPAEELVTAAARAEWLEMAKFPNSVNRLFNDPAQTGHDTVGAVAMDRHGNFAAATSTGGITFKRVGRVGDSPIVGAGCLADNTLGAISTTGHGESILRFTLGSRILLALSDGSENREERHPVNATVGACLDEMWARLGGCGGAICLNPTGELGISFTTERMAWAMRSTRSGGVRCGIDRAAARGAGAGADGLVELVDVGHPRTEWPRPQARQPRGRRASEWRRIRRPA